jgi:hypothetical protein
VGSEVVGAGASLGKGIGGGALVASRGCVGGKWWTEGHPARGQAVGSVAAAASSGGGCAWEVVTGKCTGEAAGAATAAKGVGPERAGGFAWAV